MYYTTYKQAIIEDMQTMKRLMQKNLDDMDLDNVDVKDRMQAIVDTMVADIDATIARVEGLVYRQGFSGGQS
jgi:predicted methyltransferase MtxX (methanogen marker protein 4)